MQRGHMLVSRASLRRNLLKPRPGRQSPILAEPFPGMAHVGLILDQREDIVAFETLAALKEG